MASVDGRRSLQDSSDESIMIECGPCVLDGTKSEAKHFCCECGDYLCESCRRLHQKFSVTKQHQVVSGKMMPGKGNISRESRFVNLAMCSCYKKQITMFCEDHKVVTCVDCNILEHRSCKCKEIDVTCAETEYVTTDLTDKILKEVIEKLETLQMNRYEDLQILSSQKAKCRDTVKSFRMELEEQLDKMEEKSLADIENDAGEQRRAIQRHIDTCAVAVNKLKSDSCPYQTAKESGDKTLVFIQNIQLSKTIVHLKTVLEEISREVMRPSISYTCDRSLIQSGEKSLGTDEAYQSQGRGKVIADMNIKSSKQVDIKSPADRRDPFISGCVFMPTGELVLCDWFNSNLKVVNNDVAYTIKECLKLASEPWDVTVIDEKEVIVTLPNIKSLLFIQVYPTLVSGSSIKLDEECRGVSVNGKLFYVSLCNGEIGIFDRDGQRLETLYKAKNLKAPYYIDTTVNGILWISDYRSHTIHGVLNGKQTYSIEIQTPFGLYTDAAQNVLVCEEHSNTILVFDRFGKLRKVLFSAKDGLNRPRCLTFRQSDNTLVVGGWAMNLLVVQME